MQRIHFTAVDLARTRLRATTGPLVEAAFAAGLLGRGAGPPYTRWQQQVRGRLPPGWASRSGSLADRDVDALLSRTRQPDPVLTQVWQAAVAPYWERLLEYLEAECETRGRIVMAGGVERLLATLHPRVTWRSPVLAIPGGPDEDVPLGGSGLVLTPSVFLNHRPGQLLDARGGKDQVVLAFAAPPGLQEAAGLWEEADDSAEYLGALVGQTRAAALRALRATCTTGQLADRLGISAAGASQHTAVLRQTGLITTRRVRNTVLHTVTPLGEALLNGRRAPDERSPQAS